MFLLSFRAASVRDSSFIEKMKKTVSCLLWLHGVLRRELVSFLPLCLAVTERTGLDADACIQN